MTRPGKIRISWIVVGALVALFGLVTTIAAAVAVLVDRAVSTVDPEAEARTPGTAHFVADEGTYVVLLVRSRHDSARDAADFRCEVSLANEQTVVLDGSRQTTSVDAGNTETIGTFDAVAGRTEVTCEADGGDNRFVIDKETAVNRIATWLLIAGVVIILAGAGLIVAGIFWRRPNAALAI